VRSLRLGRRAAAVKAALPHGPHLRATVHEIADNVHDWLARHDQQAVAESYRTAYAHASAPIRSEHESHGGPCPATASGASNQ
jgi:hypothetical protein